MRECPTSAVLLGFLEDELSRSVEDQVAAHLRDCPGCQAIVDQLVDDLELRRLEHNARRRDRVRLPELTTATLRQNLYALGPMLGSSPGQRGEDERAPRAGKAHRARPRLRKWRVLQRPPAAMHGETLGVTEAGERLVGRFRLCKRIGAGSCGVVYLAEDTLLHRQVALKLPRVPSLVDPELGERFVREARATASLHHPNIVPVYEAGQTGELCYLTTAYCSGPTLAEWLRDQTGRVPPDMAARIVRDLADAVAHAHCQGILHRDIKPANVLLDGAAGGELPFTPKLTDFGLARLLESDRTATASGVVFGTPRYMAPEQANGKRALCGPATDVYSLGAILYELLCGRPPIEGGDSAETLLRLVLVEPPPLRRLAPHVPADLEAIARKCLEKDSVRRYASASDLADDLRRFLDQVPTQARPQSWMERVVGAARRHPQVALPSIAVVLVAVLLAAATGWHNSRLRDLNGELDAALGQAGRANQRVENSARVAQASARAAAQLLYVSDLRLAGQAWSAGDPQRCRELLERHRPDSGEKDPRGFEWHYLWNLGQSPDETLCAGGAPLYGVCCSPDGRYLAAAGQDSVVRVYDAASQEPLAALDTRQVEVNGIAFGIDGGTLVTAGDDGTVRVWNWADQIEQRRIAAHAGQAYQVVIVPGESLLVSCGDDPVIRLWDLQSGRSRGTLEGHQRSVEALALSPDGRTLASASSDRVVRLWDLASRREVGVLNGHEGRLMAVAFSPDGRLLASGGLDRTARLWDARSGKLLATQRFLDEVQSVAFSSDGGQLCVGDRGGAVHRYEVPDVLTSKSLSQTGSWSAHDGRVYAMAASPDGRGLLAVGEDGEFHLWLARNPVSRTLSFGEPATDVAFLPGSNRLVVSTKTKLLLCEADSNRRSALASTPESGWAALAVSPLGDRLAAGNESGLVCLWELPGGTVQATWRVGEAFPIDELGFHPDGSQLAVASRTRDEAVLLFHVPSGARTASVPTIGCNHACFSPDGGRLAIAADNDVTIWDLKRKQTLVQLGDHRSTVNAVAFTSGGNQLVSVSNDRKTILWDLGDEGPVRSKAGRHHAEVRCAAFAPDGRSYVSGDSAGSLKIWHAATGQELIELPQQPSGCRRIALSDDGNYLACLTDSGKVSLLRIREPACP